MGRAASSAGIALAIAVTAFSARADGRDPRGPTPKDTSARVGFYGGLPYVRAFDDELRLYPEAAVRIDATWSPDKRSDSPVLGSEESGPHIVLRRLVLGMSGEVFRRVAFTAELEMGGQRIGQTPASGVDSVRRWARADAHDGVVRPAQVSISVRPWRALAFTVGQVSTPFSMSNRTPEKAGVFMERPLPIRGLAAPNERALGVMAWGELEDRAFAYELGVFAGQMGSAFSAGNLDLEGRVFVRPFTHLGRGVFFELTQIGMSARLGTRDPASKGVVPPSLATGQGFVMFRPFDGIAGLPEGPQRAFGGELRVPVRTPTRAVFDLRAEAYLVRDETSAPGSPSSFGATIVQAKAGRLQGAAWYVSLDWWACFIPGFEQLVTGEPGITRPPSLDERRVSVPKSALMASVLAGGINADSLDGGPTPPGLTPKKPLPVTIYQLGGTVQYLLGTNLRVALEYMAYVAPHSGEAALTRVFVPGNLPSGASPLGNATTHVAHELGLRIGAGL